MKKKVVIIGAGISGLALGWLLYHRFSNEVSIKILEKQPMAGGWIQSTSNKNFLFEEGPRSFRTKNAGIATLNLIEALGLENEVVSASSGSKLRYLYFQEKLQQLPKNFIEVLLNPLTRKIPLSLFREWKIPKSPKEDESIYTFFSRRFGIEITERFVDPLVSGIYAGDIHQLSIKGCFPKLYNYEKQYGSLTKGFWKSIFTSSPRSLSPFVRRMQKTPIFSFRHGMNTLIEALTKKLENSIQFNTDVQELQKIGSQISIKLEDKKEILADKVYLALPAHAILKLINKNQDITHELSKLKAASVAVVNMGWKDAVLNKAGFGYLIPSIEKQSILGVVWDSSAFPDQNNTPTETRLTVMLGGVHNPKILDLSSNIIFNIAKNAINKHLSISQPPDAWQVKIAQNAIPQYTSEYLQAREKIKLALEDEFNGCVNLIGSFWNGVSVNDCIAEAYQVVENFQIT